MAANEREFAWLLCRRGGILGRAIMRKWIAVFLIAGFGPGECLEAQEIPVQPLKVHAERLSEALREEAGKGMAKAAIFYRTEAASHGGYVYFYSEDLGVRWGEGPATREQVWVQPPATPTVGMALLAAHEATGAPFYLAAAVSAAEALAFGQLKSGGWTNLVDFDPASERRGDYRNGKGSEKGKSFSTLDDGISQGALRLLIRVDGVLQGKNATIREAVTVSLEALLAAQFPNGGFPQGWDETPAGDPPVATARYPDYDWRTEGRIKDYWDLYTLNDGLAGTVAATLEDAHAVYGEARYREALVKLGEFLLLAQMPEPQPGWAQQYSYDMIPVWARAFEPPAIAGRESRDAMETLMTIAVATQDARFLKPVPAGLNYLKKSLLTDGRLARYYEMETNKPLYMEREGEGYRLTHDDSKLPDHYGWKEEIDLDAMERRYRQIMETGKDEIDDVDGNLERRVREIVEALDEKGRWVSVYDGERLIGQAKFKPGDRYLSSEVFSENMETLARYWALGK